MGEEAGDGGWGNATHRFKFTGLLTVEKLAGFAEDGDGRDATVKRDLVLCGDVEIGIVTADVDVDEEEVGFEEKAILVVVEVDVEDLAIGTPVAAEVEEDALVGLRGGLYS